VDLEQDIHMFLRELTLSGRSQSSLSRYRLTMQQFADFCAENRISYLHISAKQVKAFRNILVQSNLGASAINSRLSHLKIFYEFLAEEERVMGNPVNRRRLSIKRAQKLPGYLSPEEKKLVLAWLEHASYNVCLAFRTMFASGLRLSECINLAPEDLLVRNHAYLLRVRRGKGDKERLAPVTDRDIALDLAAYAKGRVGSATLFGLSAADLQKTAQACAQATGVEFHSHRCRHTFATELLRRGVPIDVVQEALGHACIETTRVYARTAPAALMALGAHPGNGEDTDV